MKTAATSPSRKRAMWLLNHSTLRAFEVPQLQSFGIGEIFLPKCFPYDEGNLSASITHEFDKTLNIPPEDLAVLNAQNWYENPSEAAWDIANRYFDLAIIAFFPKQIKQTLKHFKGAIVVRAFGHTVAPYGTILMWNQIMGERVITDMKRCGKRFWFGMGYDHLHEIETGVVKDRSIYLPVGLKSPTHQDPWEGKDARIGTIPAYHAIYSEFTKNFSDFEYIIGGAQPFAVADKHVLGYVPKEQHIRNMTQSRVMFYHSREPNHIHYHPFEAVRAGMPLIFMAGGMLDRLGGRNLVGRCNTIQEAREKIKRLMKGDKSLIKAITQSQTILLESVSEEKCAPHWQSGLNTIFESLDAAKQETALRPVTIRKKRIAVILPIVYTTRDTGAAKLVAEAILQGSIQSNEPVDIVFAHLDDPNSYPDSEFTDLPPCIKRRTYAWQLLDQGEAERAMHYAGFKGWKAELTNYAVPDDGIQKFQDCDLLVFISDRINQRILPLKPYVTFVYDYLQRYINILPNGLDANFLDFANRAEKVIVTTEFTNSDALQYAGLKPDRVERLPMLIPTFSERLSSAAPLKPSKNSKNYFLWTSNTEPHKNHKNSFLALYEYYEVLGGTLECRLTGVGTEKLLKTESSTFAELRDIWKSSKDLQDNLVICGELSDRKYQEHLSDACFLWNAAKVDNRTFDVLEAAQLGVPSLSSNYPTMREIESRFHIQMQWMDSEDPKDMAHQLKHMEENYIKLQSSLKNYTIDDFQDKTQNANLYWKAIKECL